MSDFKSRLKQEQEDLDEKVNKLDYFINVNHEAFQKVDSQQQVLLKLQLGIMASYNHILIERIKLLG